MRDIANLQSDCGKPFSFSTSTYVFFCYIPGGISSSSSVREEDYYYSAMRASPWRSEFCGPHPVPNFEGTISYGQRERPYWSP